MSAYSDAVRMLAGRELSAARLRTRLREREYPPAEVEAALERLRESGALDDRRVAVTYARSAATTKGRGRLRIARELLEMGIARETAAAALAEVFGDLDERALVAAALQKKLRGRTRIADRAEQARLYQHLLRQGFTPAIVVSALRKLGAEAPDE